MTQNSPAKKAQDMACKLKIEWLALLKKGFGKDELSSDETKDASDMLQFRIEKVFLMYAEVKMSQALEIETWLAAETGIVEKPDSEDY